MTEVNDEKWNEFRMVTDERIGEVLIQSDNGEDIGYTMDDITDVRESVDFLVGIGERRPDRRKHIMGSIKQTVKVIGISYNRRLVFPPLVQEALDEIEGRYKMTMENKAETMVTFQLPMFRRQNHNSVDMCWLDEAEYVESKVKTMISKLKGLYNKGQWDGTISGLSEMRTTNQVYNQGDES